MMSRITISLRKYAKPDEDDWVQERFPQRISFLQPPRPPMISSEFGHTTPVQQNKGPGRVRWDFDTYAAEAETYVPPPPQTQAQAQETTNFSTETDYDEHSRWFGTISATATTPAVTPRTTLLLRSPVPTFAEWTFGLGRRSKWGVNQCNKSLNGSGPSGPSSRVQSRTQTSVPSEYSQSSVGEDDDDDGEYEMDDIAKTPRGARFV